MKRLIFIVLIIVVTGLITYGIDNQDKLFKVEIKIKFDGLTSYQVAEVERAIQQIHKYGPDGKEVKREYSIEMKAK